MRYAYPIVISSAKEGGYSVYIPGWDVFTQGETYEECLHMAEDVIGLCGIDYEDDGKPFPSIPSIAGIKKGPEDLIAIVDVDFVDYRKKNDKRSVRQNCTIPAWLQNEAKKKNANFSHLLQDAVMRFLGY